MVNSIEKKKEYTKEEIKEASKQAYFDLLEGKILPTKYREITNTQIGEIDFSKVTVISKYKLDDINFLKENKYLS